MYIVVAARCYNEQKNIQRFLLGYDWADTIVVSDGGSTDNSVSMLQQHPKVRLIHFNQQETVDGQTWNPDAPHMNFVLDVAKELQPNWLIFDDMDDVPNYLLRENARHVLENTQASQVNAFRLYLWGNTGQYFPYMNRNFDSKYTSLWAWQPNEIDIHADLDVRHGTLVGLSKDPFNLQTPYCLLHKSWHPDTIQAKMERYNKLGLPMNHPLTFAGNLEKLPLWAKE